MERRYKSLLYTIRLRRTLDYYETKTVLLSGGTFVLKIFTMFEDTTINLMYLLNCLFDDVSVFKPCSSKSGNSEVYVINTNFKGFDALSYIWPKLISIYNNTTAFSLRSMFSLLDLPDVFFEDVFACVDFFMTKQIHMILDNIYHFENKIKSESNKIFWLKTSVAHYYMLLYKPKWIPNDRKIVPNVSVGDNWRVHAVHRERGYTCVSAENLVKYELTMGIINIKIGKQIGVVQNSKFMQKDNLQKVSFLGNRKCPHGLYNLILRYLQKNNEIFNVRDFCLDEYYKFQKILFRKVYNSLDSGLNIIFINVPFHTHFLVGLLYILFFAFEKIYFGGGVIILYRSKIESIKKVKEVLSIIQQHYDKVNEQNLMSNKGEVVFEKDIVQIIPSSYFDETCSSLVGLIWNYNNQISLKSSCSAGQVISFKSGAT